MSIEEVDQDTRKKLYEDLGVWEKSHSIGVSNLLINTILLMRWPQYFWCWHLVKAFVYIPWCFMRKKRQGYERFLIEFCYVNVYYTVAFCMVGCVRVFFGIETPLHALNFLGCRTVFAFANGALLLSVPMFGNKLVFHDIDNTIALYIHLSPGFLTWSLRWGGGYGTSLIERAWPSLFDICADMEADGFLKSINHMFWSWDDCHADLQQLVLDPASAWLLLWGLPYFLLRFCLARGYIERKGKHTMYGEVFSKGGQTIQRKSLLALPESIRPLVWMLQHLAWTTFACFLSVVMWHSFALHTLLLLACLTLALHNGSTFLFRVVAMKKVPELLKGRPDASVEGQRQGEKYEPLPVVNE